MSINGGGTGSAMVGVMKFIVHELDVRTQFNGKQISIYFYNWRVQIWMKPYLNSIRSTTSPCWCWVRTQYGTGFNAADRLWASAPATDTCQVTVLFLIKKGTTTNRNRKLGQYGTINKNGKRWKRHGFDVGDIFTAPRTGIYFFSFTGLADFPASSSVFFY